MAIKMTMTDGTVIEGTAEELAKLDKIITNNTKQEKPVQAGNIIRITDGLGNRNGEKMTVASVSSSGEVIRVEETDERLNIGEIDFEIIERKEKPKFAEGDYVKVIGETLYGDITDGTYAKVSELSQFEDGLHRIELIDGSKYDLAFAHYLEKAELTDGVLSFIRAGREPGECRVGDIVEYDDAMWFENKGLGEVVGISDASGDPLVSAKNYQGVDSNYYLYKEDVKLVAPASARVDKDA